MSEYMSCGFWRRIAANFIDVVILVLAYMLLLIPLALIFFPTELFMTYYVLGTLLFLFYVPIFESSSMQATLGYYILGMKIINDNGSQVSFLKSLVRFIILELINCTVILMIISIGCMMFTDKKKFLHDILCSTRMIRR